jgi:hypothetical protein
MAMRDLVIRGATVVDGLGHDPIRADLAVRDGDLFVEAHQHPPKHIILDLDATDDPLHGHQEGRFFHGYYDGYCDLPLYIFCGPHLLASKLGRADIDAAAGAVRGNLARRDADPRPLAAGAHCAAG